LARVDAMHRMSDGSRAIGKTANPGIWALEEVATVPLGQFFLEDCCIQQASTGHSSRGLGCIPECAAGLKFWRNALRFSATTSLNAPRKFRIQPVAPMHRRKADAEHRSAIAQARERPRSMGAVRAYSSGLLSAQSPCGVGLLAREARIEDSDARAPGRPGRRTQSR